MFVHKWTRKEASVDLYNFFDIVFNCSYKQNIIMMTIWEVIIFQSQVGFFFFGGGGGV